MLQWESETALMNFPYSFTLKSTGLQCTLNESFTLAWFCNMQALVFWKTLVHWIIHIFQNVKTFHYIQFIFKKITFVNITTDFIRNSLSPGMLSSSWWQIQIFQILNIHEVTGSSWLFWENVCKYPSLNNHGLSVDLSNKNEVT